MKHLELFEQHTDKKGRQIDEYNYIDLITVKNGLWVRLNKEGFEELKENQFDYDFYELFDDVRGNSEYMFISDLAEYGIAMTSAPAILHGYYYDDDGNITDEGHDDSKIYWFPNYMLEDYFETLTTKGAVFFEKS